MTPPVRPTIEVPAGMVACTTYGSMQMETIQSLLEMRSYTEQQGIRPIWDFVPGALVDRARNQAVARFLAYRPLLGWLLFVDGDAVFKPDALCNLLSLAYGGLQVADALGAHCSLKGKPYLPTVDTGTGTWESGLPGTGPVQVMRTGSAFILMKRHCFEKVPGPWYGTRNPMRPVDAMAEVDNYAHTRFDGRNPLSDIPEWQTLLKCAREEGGATQPHDPSAFVGEDSNWCDRMRFYGLNIWVQNDVEVHHVDRKVITPADHKLAMLEGVQMAERLVGVNP